MQSILSPPIAWRFYIVYWRKPDGRTVWFRGSRRRALFVKNLDSDWVTEPELARLFERDPPEFTDHNFAKWLRAHPVRQQVNYKGFADTVLASHLLIPAKPRRTRPPG